MKKLLPLIALIIFTVINGFAQSPIWNKTDERQITTSKVDRNSNPEEYLLYSLNLEALKEALKNAPSRNFNQVLSNVIVAFPNPEGELQNFRIYEASVLSPELAARHPEIKSYIGTGIDDRTATIRFSVTLFGLHTMTFSGVNGVSYIDTYTKDLKNYIVYNKSHLTNNSSFQCDFQNNENAAEDAVDNPSLGLSNNSLFKTYRLALACTTEYSAYQVNAAGLNSGTLAQKKAAVLAAMNVTMTRVNGVYERDFAVTMVLVPNNEDIIFITADVYSNNNGSAMLTQNQTVTDAAIGFDNYDIGHVFSTGGGGVAYLGCVCAANKAGGVTGLTDPVGDAYDIDYVAHEMGHQFGGEHTFNSTSGACGGGNRTATAAYEPGSGTTIMAYAGICAPQNVQEHSGDYFHAKSMIQMSNFINGGGATCAVATPITNTPPVVDAGENFTIPKGTAFILKGSATDAEQSALTYCWEQYNLGTSSLATPTSPSGPNFRSFLPTTSPNRYCPSLNDVLANNLAPTWEVVPNVARVLTFSLIVRDNGTPEGGQTERATMNLTIANTGPFKVTSQTTNAAWSKNSTQVVTWDVAGTTANNINTAFVNIKLSTDGGLNFDTILAANTPNDGSESIVVPNTVALSQTCRIMVEAVGNIYYAVNTTQFPITPSLSTKEFGLADFSLYPNPNKGDFTVNFRSTSNSDINIVVNDLRGRKIFAKKYTNTGIFNQKLQLNNIQAGVYLITVQDGAQKEVKRIYIE